VSEKRDYYEVLGVARTAEPAEIKSAYRKLAVKFHPDRNPGDGAAEERFKEAAEAYAILSDPDKRAQYDRFGHQGVSGQPFTGFDASIFGDFADILGNMFGFEGIFGGSRRRSGPDRGSDLRTTLTLSFDEMASGIERTIVVPREEACEVCGGSGARKGSRPESCRACGGRGQVRVSQGFFTMVRSCPQCGGTGQVIADPCETCNGAGRVERRREIKVSIPAGIEDGSRLRVTGQGESGHRGGPPGDLYVIVRVEAHERFERDGADLHVEVEVSAFLAALGTAMDVLGLAGSESIDVPGGTQMGDTLTLRGKGLPRVRRAGRGDFIVHFKVVVPRRLSAHQRELLVEIVGEEERPGVFQKVREFLEGNG